MPALEEARLRYRSTARSTSRGSGTTLDEMTLDATGTLTDSSLFGHAPAEMAFGAQIADRASDGDRRRATFEELDPARDLGRQALDGNVSGTRRRDGSHRRPDGADHARGAHRRPAASRSRRSLSAACRSQAPTSRAV